MFLNKFEIRLNIHWILHVKNGLEIQDGHHAKTNLILDPLENTVYIYTLFLSQTSLSF
jgi:hypothetical protein